MTGSYVGTARATRRPFSAGFTHLFTADHAGERLTRLVQLTDTALWIAALEPLE